MANPPSPRRHIPLPTPEQDAAETSDDALAEVVDDAIDRWDRTRDEDAGLLSAERDDASEGI